MLVLKKKFKQLIQNKNIPYIDNRNNIIKSSLLLAKADDKLITLSSKGNVASGYVPYIKSSTNLFLYHFFSINYGHRRTFKLNISLFGEDTKPILSTLVNLDARTSLKINIDELFNDHTNLNLAYTCCVSILSDRIQPNHAGHEGHFRFCGVYDNFAGLVHSSAIPLSISTVFKKYKKPIIAARRNFLKNCFDVKNYSIFNSSIDIVERGDLYKHKSGQLGFSVTKNKKNQITGCWHNSEYYFNSLKKTNLHDFLIFIPPVPDIDAQIYFSECCRKGTIFKLSLQKFDKVSSKNLTIFETSIEADIENGLRISEIIPKKINLKNKFWILLKPISGDYRETLLNIVYLSKKNHGSFDSVHSSRFERFKGNCLKFAPFFIDNSFDSWICLPGGQKEDVFVRLKFFFENDVINENVIIVKIKKKTVEYVSIKKLFSNLPLKIKRGVVQVESLHLNHQASIFIIKKGEVLQSLATDHFTGG